MKADKIFRYEIIGGIISSCESGEEFLDVLRSSYDLATSAAVHRFLTIHYLEEKGVSYDEEIVSFVLDVETHCQYYAKLEELGIPNPFKI